MDENRKALAKYRLEKAEKCIRIAQISVENDDYETAANRSYYAMFHCIRALLALEGVDYKKHSMVISHFRREYIKTGIFDRSLSDYIGSAFDVRAKSDYDDFYAISISEVEQQIHHAKNFYADVKKYIEISVQF